LANCKEPVYERILWGFLGVFLNSCLKRKIIKVVIVCTAVWKFYMRNIDIRAAYARGAPSVRAWDKENLMDKILMGLKKIALFGLLFFIPITAANAQEKLPASSKIVSERLLAETDPSSLVEDSFIISPDSRHIAYIIREGSKQFAVIDGNRGKGYDSIDMLNFDDEDKSFHYTAREGQKEFSIRDGATTVLESDKNHPDSYEAEEISKTSPDGKRKAEVITRGEKQIAVVDGKENAKSYVSIDGLKFSADSQHVVYRAHDGKKFCMVVDDIEGKRYDFIGPSILSRHSGRIAYLACEKNLFFIILDGKKEKGYSNYSICNLLFSPDGSHFAYAANSYNGEGFVVLDGKPGKRYHSVENIVFSPDSKHLAYTAEAANTGKRCIVVDEKEIASYDMAWPPVFDSKTGRMAYKIRSGDKYHLVIDGKIGKAYDFIWVGTPVLTPDGDHIIYIARESNIIFLVLDENESERKFDGISTIGGNIIFDSPEKFHYIARRGGAIYFVEESIE